MSDPATNLVTFDYQGAAVAFDPSAKMWSLNAMHRAAGSLSHKTPGRWLGLVQTQELLGALAEESKLPLIRGSLDALSDEQTTEIFGSFVETREGRTGGTWACPELALAYAHFLSPGFYLACNRWMLSQPQSKRQRSMAYLAVPRPDEAQILALLEITRDPNDLTSSTEIAARCTEAGIALAYTLRGQQMAVAGVLARAGLRRMHRTNARQSRIWQGVRLAA